MKKRTLGRSGIDIAPLVLGGNVFGWTADEARSFERGFKKIDTADSYANWAPGLSQCVYAHARHRSRRGGPRGRPGTGTVFV